MQPPPCYYPHEKKEERGEGKKLRVSCASVPNLPLLPSFSPAACFPSFLAHVLHSCTHVHEALSQQRWTEGREGSGSWCWSKGTAFKQLRTLARPPRPRSLAARISRSLLHALVVSAPAAEAEARKEGKKFERNRSERAGV